PASTYQFDIVVDPDALLAKLEAFGGRPISSGLGRIERDGRIAALARVFLDRVVVRFDDFRVDPAFEYTASSAFSDLAQSPSIVRLSGSVPRGARAVTFAYALALGSYALNVRIDDGPVQTFWLEGVQASPSISLVAPPPTATAREVAGQ